MNVYFSEFTNNFPLGHTLQRHLLYPLGSRKLCRVLSMSCEWKLKNLCFQLLTGRAQSQRVNLLLPIDDTSSSSSILYTSFGFSSPLGDDVMPRTTSGRLLFFFLFFVFLRVLQKSRRISFILIFIALYL